VPIEFKKADYEFTYLDPRQDFTESPISLEARFDPLTGEVTNIYGTQFRSYLPGLTKPDLSALVEKSLQLGCPFCPGNLETMTPKFPERFWKEGRIELGEARVFPNMMPYAPYCAIGVFSSQHFYELPDLSPGLMANGLAAAVSYLSRVEEYDPAVRFANISWNHLPPSGGSIVHPHLQLLASYGPSNRHRELLRASREYRQQNGADYWADLVAAEKECGERYIGNSGGVSWLMPFAPRGRLLDVMAVFEGAETLHHLTPELLKDFATGLSSLFRYLDGENMYSFNMTVYIGYQADGGFWCHSRIVPRTVIPPMGMSDVSFLELLHDQPGTFRSPEEACAEMRPHFSRGD
jgi:galactose-1-phosphate uridylyltransferase